MRVEINGYFDHNLGDDLMIGQALERINGAFLSCDGKKSDIRLTVSGSCFLVPDNRALMYRMREVYLKGRNRRSAYIGCNISPFINRAAERVIKNQLSRAELITVRDRFSYDYIKASIRDVSCGYFPDMVFAENTPARTGGKALGITAYGATGSFKAEKFAYIADRYIEDNGENVILFAFDTGRENDMAAAKEIYGHCRHREKIRISGYFSDKNRILRDAAECAAMIAVRHHGVVLALKMGISAIPVAYSAKTVNMLNDLKFGDKVFEYGSFDEREVYESIYKTGYTLDRRVTEEAKGHIKMFLDMLDNHRS